MRLHSYCRQIVSARCPRGPTRKVGAEASAHPGRPLRIVSQLACSRADELHVDSSARNGTSGETIVFPKRKRLSDNQISRYRPGPTSKVHPGCAHSPNLPAIIYLPRIGYASILFP